jgi:hypothetical protein
MLGGFVMAGPNAQPREGADTARQSLIRAQTLLEQALDLIDTHAGAPELSARIQEVVDRLKSKTG